MTRYLTQCIRETELYLDSLMKSKTNVYVPNGIFRNIAFHKMSIGHAASLIDAIAGYFGAACLAGSKGLTLDMLDLMQHTGSYLKPLASYLEHIVRTVWEFPTYKSTDTAEETLERISAALNSNSVPYAVTEKAVDVIVIGNAHFQEMLDKVKDLPNAMEEIKESDLTRWIKLLYVADENIRKPMQGLNQALESMTSKYTRIFQS